MKIIISTLILITCYVKVLSQEKKTIYIEVFGQGLNGSINFDYKFDLGKKFEKSYTAGVVLVPKFEEFGEGFYFGIPVSYNWFLGKKNHQLELGLGFTPLIVNEFGNQNYARIDNFYTYLTPKIGYRFQQRYGGLFFRVTATPMIALFNTSFNGSYKKVDFFNNVAGLGYRVFPWPGVSIGWTLKTKRKTTTILQ